MLRMGLDRTSSVPSSVLHLKVDKGQGSSVWNTGLIQSCTTSSLNGETGDMYKKEC